ncbi:DAP3-binding cell death enhancer 1-like [Ptychodera flava]|uniref:DAP3-binding cell death enhancer 1-like n=1 Tax=Ptychodera flava TaxID=63121 RepID=UPI003969F057
MMWRILQNVQRGLRHLHHGQPLRTTNVSQQNKRREEHQGLPVIPRCCGGQQQLQVARHHQDVGSGDAGNGSHNDREDWNSFRQGFNWSSCDSCKHSMFEAIGWGTVLLVSLQLSKQFNKLDQWKCDDDKKRFRRALYRFARAMPKPSRLGMTTRRSILEEGKNQQDSAQKAKTPQEIITEATSQLESLGNESTGIVLNALGLNYAREGSLVKAAEQFRQAADMGYAKALYNLGLCYEEGRGVKKCLTKAADYYQLAAAKGHPMALYNLAVFYLLGLGGLPKDSRKSVELMEQAAEKGLQQAQVYMGTYYLEEPHINTERAVGFFEEGSKDEDAECQYYLGMCYEQGWGVSRNEAKAADMYSKAAKQNHTDAQYNLAVFNELGLGGLPEDREYARQLYTLASKSGSELATQCLERLDMEDRLKLMEEEAKQQQFPVSESLVKQLPLEVQEKRVIHTSASSPSLSSMAEDSDTDMRQLQEPKWVTKGSLSVFDLILPSIFSYRGLQESGIDLKHQDKGAGETDVDFDGESWLTNFGVNQDACKLNGIRGSFGVAVV